MKRLIFAAFLLICGCGSGGGGAVVPLQESPRVSSVVTSIGAFARYSTISQSKTALITSTATINLSENAATKPLQPGTELFLNYWQDGTYGYIYPADYSVILSCETVPGTSYGK